MFEKEKLNSVVAILNQIVSYQMYKSTEEKRKIRCLYSSRYFKYSVVDFDRKDEILEKGI